MRPEQQDAPPLAYRAPDPAAGEVGDDSAGVGSRGVGAAGSVPAVPERDHRVRGEVVGSVRLPGQQVRQAGEFGMVAFEECVELCGRLIFGHGLGTASRCDGGFLRQVPERNSPLKHSFARFGLPGPGPHGDAHQSVGFQSSVPAR